MDTIKPSAREAGQQGWNGLRLRFLRNRRGTAAIEFGMLAIPFSLLLFAILETCISFAAQQVLSNSADAVARQLRTGQIKAADMTETKLRDMICGRLEIIVTEGCPGLILELQDYPSFEEAAKVRLKLTADREIDAVNLVSPGTSMTINMLRVFYPWPVMTDLMRKRMSNLKDGKTLLFTSVIWQNEPFDD